MDVISYRSRYICDLETALRILLTDFLLPAG